MDPALVSRAVLLLVRAELGEGNGSIEQLAENSSASLKCRPDWHCIAQ
jgi:hypothetical protein